MTHPKHIFKPGDKVEVFRGGREPFRGVVTIARNTAIFVTELGFYSGHDENPFHPRQLELVESAPEAKLPDKILTWSGERDLINEHNKLIDFCASLEARIKELET